MQSELRMERRKLSDLLPAEYNPRVTLEPDDKEFQDLVGSIRTLGYAEPILINEDGTIIGGHQRYNALLYLGWEEADVVVYPCSKVKEKALNVALNKIDGRWDAVKLVNILEQISLEGVDFTVTGFTQDELDDLKVDLQVETATAWRHLDLRAASPDVRRLHKAGGHRQAHERRTGRPRDHRSSVQRQLRRDSREDPERQYGR